MRRRLGVWLAGAVLAVAAAAGVLVLADSPVTRHASARTRLAPVPAPLERSARGVTGRGLTARGLANIRRLAALGRPIYCGGPHGNAVAFTFDDGPGVYTHLAVRKLAQAHEEATFFVVGKSIAAWPGWLPRETRVGALGDHTMLHQDLLEMPLADARWEIAAAQRMIERRSGQPVVLFRPPYGAHDRAVDVIVRRLGMLEVMWSVDSADSLGANYAGIIRNVERGLRPGAIIAMHENRGQTIRALTTLLPALRRRHLRSVSLVSLLASDPPTPAQVRRGEPACGGQRSPRGRGAE